MKKNTITKRNVLMSMVLTIALVFCMSTETLAAWENYSGNVYSGANSNVWLEETWLGGKQCINYYANGQWKRNVAGEGHTLWINSMIVLNDLYNTGYWCFDVNGNCFVIDTNQRLLCYKLDSTTPIVNTSVSGCTGFQRDNGKIGYLVYTNYGTYSLDTLLTGNSYSNNNTNYNSYNSYNTDATVTQNGNVYKYTYGGNTYTYELVGTALYYNGRSIKSNVSEIAFANGYVLYVTTSRDVYRIAIGSTSGTKIGSNFMYFIWDNSGWVTYVQVGNKQVGVNTGSSYNSNYYDDYDYYNDNYVKKSGNYYYYYYSSSKYYKYQLSGSTLYYKGTNSSSSSSTSIASSVDEITFTEGYIVYATTSGYVYAIPVGKTSSSYKEQVGSKFDYFDEEDDYWSQGYYNTSDRYIEFCDILDCDNDYYYDDDDDYNYDDGYVEKSGSNYYYYTSSNKYYKYYLSGSTLYYKGTNSSSSSTSIASSVDEITFTDGYIVYALTSGKVYMMEIGKTSSSYKEYIGDDFDYFDEEDDYWSYGYYDEDDDYVEFN